MAGRIVTVLVVFQLLSMTPIIEIESIEGRVLLMVKLIGWLGIHYAVIWVPVLICLTNKKALKIFDKIAKKVLA